MKAYKGFSNDMKCRGFQFEEGKSYEEDVAKLCECGFHACERPLDVFEYYPPGRSVYHEVELKDVSNARESDSKVCAKKIKIGAALNILDMVKAHVDYTKIHCTSGHIDLKAATAGNYGAATVGVGGAATAGRFGAAMAGYAGAATAGYAGAATAGDAGAATVGDAGAATVGDAGTATAGNYGAATAGNYGAATVGVGGAATAGRFGAAMAGYAGAATVGDYGTATSRGRSTTGKYGLSVARGNGVCVKGGMGAMLVIAEENNDGYEIKGWKVGTVDGNTLKPDVWYRLENGDFVEVSNGH